MTVLSDADIAQEIHYQSDGLNIDPYDESNLQPASYDLTLGDEFVKYYDDGWSLQGVDIGPTDKREVVAQEEYVVRPGEFVLGYTVEHVELPANISAEVKGRSSLGRLGLIPHTAGWIDPGFEGQITLEFVNHSPQPVVLKAGMRCAQIVFSYTNTASNNPYGDKDDQKYQGQTGVTESRIEEDEL